MRLRITARRVGLEDPRRSDLEEWLRLLLGSWTCQIREAKVCFEDESGSKGGLDMRCAIEAALIPSGRITVQGLGTDTESAMRAAVRQLLRRVKREFHRKQVGIRIER